MNMKWLLFGGVVLASHGIANAAQAIPPNQNGIAAASPGSGASGVFAQSTTGTLNGAAGASGYVVIWEYSA